MAREPASNGDGITAILQLPARDCSQSMNHIPLPFNHDWRFRHQLSIDSLRSV